MAQLGEDHSYIIYVGVGILFFAVCGLWMYVMKLRDSILAVCTSSA
jgi:hypothetical protein